jgi:hypothetical protein
VLACARVSAPRRLSQAISEGDGISLIVEVEDARSATEAELAGAKALVLRGGGGDARPVREATTIPLILFEADPHGVADACIVRADAEPPQGASELIFNVTSDEELEEVLERHDPEILLLSAGEDGVEPVLELLADVPAGKLAIGALWEPAEDELAELERAGCDAVLVGVLTTAA